VGAGVDGVGQWVPVQQRGLSLLGLGLAAGVRVPTPVSQALGSAS